MGRKKIEMPKLNKISTRTLEKIRKDTSKYIYIKDKNGNAFCERCNKKFVLPNTKHLEEHKCPECKAKLKILHTWRRKKEQRFDWKVTQTVLSDTEIVFRYILCERDYDKIIQLKEVARKYRNLETNKDYEWELSWSSKQWERTRRNYFTEFFMGTYRTSLCCLQADSYDLKRLIKDLQTMTNFKYLDFTDFIPLIEKWYVDRFVACLYRKSLIYEQLQKAGYNQLILDDFDRNYYSSKKILYDSSKKSLAKKIGLSDNDFKRLYKYQNLETYTILLNHPNVSDKEFENLLVLGEYGYEDIVSKCKFYHLKLGKTIQYIKKKVVPSGLTYRDYTDYLYSIDRMNYPIDNRYAYPKDFKKSKNDANAKLNEYYERQKNLSVKDKAIDEAKKDKKIYLISKALNESKELRNWFKGVDGLKVMVPESIGELTDSGINLHNCLGNYANRIAENQSLIFFIRRIDEPDKDYIAMEYANGELIQIRLDDNKPVTDKKIISFADALVRKLNEINARETIIKPAIKEVA